MERTHGQLGTWFADGLGGDDADGLSALHQAAGGQVAAVAGHANAALGFAGEHRANLDALDTGRLNCRRQVFGDLLVDAHDDIAFVVLIARDARGAAVPALSGRGCACARAVRAIGCPAGLRLPAPARSTRNIPPRITRSRRARP